MRFPLVLAAALTAAGLVAGPVRSLLGQEREDSRPTGSSAGSTGPDRLMRIVMNRRARLGIKVNLQARAAPTRSAPTWNR